MGLELDKIRLIAEKEMKNRRSHDFKDMGNKYYHGLRTAKLALDLRRRLFPGLDTEDELLTVSAWFHDVRNGEDDHCVLGAQTTARLLKGTVPEPELERICEIISVHDRRYDSYDPIIYLHQDADLLDHFGAYDIMMNASYGITMGESSEELRDRFFRETQNGIDNHRHRLHYDFSKELFDKRVEFQFRFAEEFKREMDCVIE